MVIDSGPDVSTNILLCIVAYRQATDIALKILNIAWKFSAQHLNYSCVYLNVWFNLGKKAMKNKNIYFKGINK